jgi:cbb3-type cytochrome oxidase cytochrome c subunit
MIQTLEAEIDEKGAVRLARPAHFDRKHRVLVMVMPDQPCGEGDEADDTWHQPHIDQPYRYLPSLS